MRWGGEGGGILSILNAIFFSPPECFHVRDMPRAKQIKTTLFARGEGNWKFLFRSQVNRPSGSK